MNFAIIGCGRVAGRHAQSIASIHGAKLVAACDILPNRAEHLVDEYGGTAYTHHVEMLKRDDIDIVCVSVPSGLHASIGQDAARAGKHILVEKPIALSMEDAEALIRTCEEEGVTLSVVLQNRFNPPMRELKQVVDHGKLGKIFLSNVTIRWFRPQSYYEDGWHGTWKMDGGVLMNQSIHHIDALQWLMGEPYSVFVYTATLAHCMEAEDTSVAVLRFKNGALGVVEGSTVTYPENLEGSIALFGERGSVKVGGTALNRKVIWKLEGNLEQEHEILIHDEIDPPTVYGHGHREQILEMIAAVREKRPPSTSGQEALKSLRIVLAMYESARLHKEIFL